MFLRALHFLCTILVESKKRSTQESFVDSFLSFIVRPCDSVRSNSVSLFAMDSYKRGTLCGERNESPSFSKRHSFSRNVARLSKLLTVGSIYRSLLKAPRAEQFHCNGFLCRTLVEKHPILKVNFSRLRLSHLTFSADSRMKRTFC